MGKYTIFEEENCNVFVLCPRRKIQLDTETFSNILENIVLVEELFILQCSQHIHNSIFEEHIRFLATEQLSEDGVVGAVR